MVVWLCLNMEGEWVEQPTPANEASKGERERDSIEGIELSNEIGLSK